MTHRVPVTSKSGAPGCPMGGPRCPMGVPGCLMGVPGFLMGCRAAPWVGQATRGFHIDIGPLELFWAPLSLSLFLPSMGSVSGSLQALEAILVAQEVVSVGKTNEHIFFKRTIFHFGNQFAPF